MLFRSIVGNLVDNALDALAGGRGGRIELTAVAESGRVVLEVRDDGPGIPDADLARIFEPGWSTKPERGAASRGLGLALVSVTAARLGGSVRAANDHGAVLTVDVPVRASTPVTTP